MGSVITVLGNARSEQALGVLRTVTCCDREYSALHGTNRAGRKIFSLSFREDGKPQPVDEPCIRQMKELKRKATR